MLDGPDSNPSSGVPPACPRPPLPTSTRSTQVLPISLMTEMHYRTIPVTAFASYLLLEVEDVAVQVERPQPLMHDAS